jgi:DNA modification methylase
MTYKILVGNNLDILPTLPDNSVDSIVTDPPYGLSDNKFVAETITRWVNGERDFVPDGKGFMGKSWDAFVPPPALWDECFRVLKPGGHLLAFFGSRTQDIGGLAIRMAGFEIRDSIGWVYGSGFPKSLDVSKAIDKGTGENKQRQLRFVNWMRATGINAKQINEATETQMASHYIGLSQPAIATADLFDKLRPYLPEVPEEIERLVAERTGIEWKAYKNREVIGQNKKAELKESVYFGNLEQAKKNGRAIGYGEFDITAPSTPEAKQWQGWGTGLKPALEPIVVARKPLIGTVAENVLTHGTGGLNIDASRIGTDTITINTFDNGAKPFGDAVGEPFTSRQQEGRWPANLILDEYTAELLDQQSGQTSSKAANRGLQVSGQAGGLAGSNPNHKEGTDSVRGHNDSGGASRFFYVAKASKRDRNEGLEDLDFTSAASMVEREPDSAGMNSPRAGAGRTSGAKNFHPTVKPTALMEYLIKLVTPPHGTVLDPFTGSGSTGKAAVLNGFDFIGIEMTEDYVPIIEGRLRHAEKVFAENETEKLF